MSEPVRLVVWDLDGTFWAGTLTEGGHTYSDINHNIIVELAKRGIVSSICSKNDFETIKAILLEKGIWDYFVFPSINWTPKGPRLKQLVQHVQLRPETVLLLDDNPLNLREAEHFVPGIQTADDSFIPRLLECPLLKGKSDPELSRLKQYRLLQTRSADAAVAEDNIEFLRSCDIRVTIEHDVEKHIDRAIELINRTNQLNFTKNRVPEDPERARAKLRKSLDRFDVQTGLVRVTDRYGDYGYCGFYLGKTRKGRSYLRHFCFSCRILNMGVENWLYERLGRPELEVVGDVLTDLSRPVEVDWINTARAISTDRKGVPEEGHPALERVVIRGACTVSPLVHYFHMDAPEVVAEFNEVRDSIQIRLDHSLTLRYAIEGLTAEQMHVLRSLGFSESDFDSKFGDASREPSFRVLSNWIDAQSVVYRHRDTGLLVPYKTRGLGKLTNIARAEDELELEGLSASTQRALCYLRDNFDFVGAWTPEEADHSYDVILDALPKGSPLFIVAAPEAGLTRGVRTPAAELNRRVSSAIARHPEKLVRAVSIAELADEEERHTGQHFDRSVYYKLYQEIWARYRALISEAATPREIGIPSNPGMRAAEAAAG